MCMRHFLTTSQEDNGPGCFYAGYQRKGHAGLNELCSPLLFPAVQTMNEELLEATAIKTSHIGQTQHQVEEMYKLETC